jgi:hypothetical protein
MVGVVHLRYMYLFYHWKQKRKRYVTRKLLDALAK